MFIYAKENCFNRFLLIQKPKMAHSFGQNFGNPTTVASGIFPWFVAKVDDSGACRQLSNRTFTLFFSLLPPTVQCRRRTAAAALPTPRLAVFHSFLFVSYFHSVASPFQIAVLFVCLFWPLRRIKLSVLKMYREMQWLVTIIQLHGYTIFQLVASNRAVLPPNFNRRTAAPPHRRTLPSFILSRLFPIF